MADRTYSSCTGLYQADRARCGDDEVKDYSCRLELQQTSITISQYIWSLGKRRDFYGVYSTPGV
jgi:hypothetical protein